MRLNLRCKVAHVTVSHSPGAPHNRTVLVTLEIPNGVVQFNTTTAEGGQWLALLGRELELHAGELVKVVPGFRTAPV